MSLHMMIEYSGVAEPCFPLKEPPNIPVKRANLSANESQLIILLKLTNHSDYADQLFRYPWSTNIVLNILIIRTNYSDESDQ